MRRQTTMSQISAAILAPWRARVAKQAVAISGLGILEMVPKTSPLQSPGEPIDRVRLSSQQLVLAILIPAGFTPFGVN